MNNAVNDKLNIDTINHALTKVIGDLLTNMTADERAAGKSAMVYSAGFRLNADLRRSIMTACAEARAEAAHLAAGDGTFEVELLARNGGKLKSVKGLVVVQLEDGRTAAATRDGRAMYTVVDGHLKRQPCAFDMATAAPKGVEALLAQLHRRLTAKVEGPHIRISEKRTDEELGLSPVDADDEAEDIGARRLIKLILAYCDTAYAAFTGRSDASKDDRQIHFAGGGPLNTALIDRFCEEIGLDREGVYLNFGDRITDGPVEATVIANRGGGHYIQRGCRPWMAEAISPLVFTLVSASGRKTHFAHDGEGGLEQEEGHPAEDLSAGYETARQTLADAALRLVVNRNPELLKQAA